MKKKSLLPLFFSLISIGLYAQDSLKLTLVAAEKLFLANNLQLINQKYQIGKAQTDVITAKLFDNPELRHENLLYNHETGRFLETSYATGQFASELSQVIKLAGKRNKNVQLANAAVKMTEHAYFDLLRTLRYELRRNFYQAYYLQQSSKVYDNQIEALQKLLRASEQQLKAGNVSQKDVIRIRSLVYSLKGNYVNLQKEIDEVNANLSVLLHTKSSTPFHLVNDTPLPDDLDKKNLAVLLDAAKANRADLQLGKAAIAYAHQNLKLQKAMAVPDIQLGLLYDLKGNYPEKYVGIGISVPLPLFNRNQGEIKKAKISIEEETNQLLLQESVVENEVFKSYQNALRITKLYQGLDQSFHADFNKLMQEVTKNFGSRNISLIEFLDFYDSYRESTIQFNQLNYELFNAKEELNYVTGTTLFK